MSCARQSSVPHVTDIYPQNTSLCFNLQFRTIPNVYFSIDMRILTTFAGSGSDSGSDFGSDSDSDSGAYFGPGTPRSTSYAVLFRVFPITVYGKLPQELFFIKISGRYWFYFLFSVYLKITDRFHALVRDKLYLASKLQYFATKIRTKC
jgi:hypothetical protein